MKRFLLSSLFPCIFKIALGWLLVGALIGEKYVFGENFVAPISKQHGSASSPVLLHTEEIQEQIIYSRGKPLLMETILEEEDPVFADIYFDEQRRFIDSRLKIALMELAELLSEEAEWGLQIEGHCDARGSSAYNFVLADIHLADLAEFLEQLGMSSHQISTVNYGQDPMNCREQTERCQEDNLRARNIFPILSAAQPQLGCLARIRLLSGGTWPSTRQASGNFLPLQRIQIASSSST